MKTLPVKPFSVLIPDAESIFALNVLRCLGKVKGVKIFLLSNSRSASVRYSRYCSQIITYEERDDSDRLHAIINALSKTKADVILPVDVKTIRLVSANSFDLKNRTSLPPLPAVESLDMADDKWLSFQWMKRNSVASPATLLYEDDEQIESDLENFSFPVLLKPRKGSGGVGIEKFENPESLMNYCAKIEKRSDNVIQSFIEGFDIDCSILCSEGEILAYTIQKRFVYTQRPVAGELGMDFIFHEQTLELVEELARKLNWSGIAHIDLRFDERDQKVKIIELNPRFWASVSYSVSAGVNFPYIACLQALTYQIPAARFSEKRLVQLRSAVKMIAERLKDRKRTDLYFDGIFLNHISFTDPLPYVVSRLPWPTKKK